MLFNSLIFPIFLAIVFIAYWFLQRNHIGWQNFLLLVASYVFYGWWDWRFLSLIAISSLVDYFTGMKMGTEKSQSKRKVLLGISLFVNLGALGVFKYFNFFIDSFATLLETAGMQANLPSLRIILPVGISFYTFQTLSYTIDIYRKKLEPIHDIIAFSAFVSFFPQLVAGPIERAKALLPQFLKRRNPDINSFKDGLRQILWGYVKKVMVADNLARHVNVIFDNHQSMDGITLFLGVFFFALQIYCDFSGYSDIAIGTARLFGFSLMRNFAFPYMSRNIGEFWRRWHISLSSWFRDYVYIPMGGSRVPKGRRIFNIIVTFSVSGFWHGANWTFIIWGFLNGLYYIPIMLRDKHKQYTDIPSEGRLIPKFGELSAIFTTFMLALLAWVFFRANSVTHALQYLWQMVTVPYSGLTYSQYLQPVLLAFFVLFIEWLQRDKQHALQIERFAVPVRWSVYVVLSLAILTIGSFGSQEFIYFQF